MTNRRVTAALLAGSMLCASCADASNRDKYAAGGMLAGAAAGAAIGSRGNSEHAGIAMIGGAIIGGLIGLMVGTRLDEAEKAQAEFAAKNAAITNKRITWTSDKRGKEIGGYAEPVREITPTAVENAKPVTTTAPANEPMTVSQPASVSSVSAPAVANPVVNAASSKGGNCRRVREVTVIRGQEQAEETTYCNAGQGWTRAG
jgi:surface antigen